jgi:purine-binding chemotaxis protein CheW
VSETTKKDSSNPADEDKHQANPEMVSAINHEPEEQYLTFFMDGEEYGIDILSVKEIRGWENPTSIPNAPAWVKGVINLRGTVVPIIDLRLRFGIKQVNYDATTVVIVVKAKTQAGNKEMGIVVDAVSDVYNFTSKNIQSAPELSSNTNTHFVRGLGTNDDVMVILLDIHALLDANDQSEFNDFKSLASA